MRKSRYIYTDSYIYVFDYRDNLAFQELMDRRERKDYRV